MIPAPLPADESERLSRLWRLEILDTPSEERFDRVTRIAARLFEVPIALVSLIDKERQWFKSRVGLEAQETPRELAFCGYAIHSGDPFVVPDATQDERFVNNPLVTGAPHIRFYAGQPLLAEDGSGVGTLCLIDRAPRELDTLDLAALNDLAELVADELARTPQLLTICSFCERIHCRDDRWRAGRAHIEECLGHRYSHGLCPDCFATQVPELESP